MVTTLKTNHYDVDNQEDNYKRVDYGDDLQKRTTTKAIIIVGCVQPPSIFEKKKKLERAPWPGNFFFFFFFLGLRRFGCTQAITINVDRILTQMCDVLKLK